MIEGKRVRGLREKRGPAAAVSSTAEGASGFPRTRWSLVVAAGSGHSEPERRDALESLCRGYWYPVCVFIRRRGHAPEEAQDLTQEFFLGLLSGTFFSRADQDIRFRRIGLRARARPRGDARTYFPAQMGTSRSRPRHGHSAR